MNVVLQKSLTEKTISEGVTELLVYSKDGSLLAVMWQLGDDDTVYMTRAGEHDFNKLCESMGVKPNVKVYS